MRHAHTAAVTQPFPFPRDLWTLPTGWTDPITRLLMQMVSWKMGPADSGQLAANDLPVLAPIFRTSPMLMLIPPCPCQLDVRITCVVSTRSSTIDASRVFPYIPRLQQQTVAR
jgi:hypothetical protein